MAYQQQTGQVGWEESLTPPPPGEDYVVVLLQQIMQQLVRIGDLIEGDRAPIHGYRFDKITILANQTNFEINVVPAARIMTVLADQPITVRLYDRNSDAIEIRGIDYPLMPPLLPASAAIGKLYITTGAASTIVRILSFG